MTQEQWEYEAGYAAQAEAEYWAEYEAGYAAQAEAEYWAEMEYYAYLDKLIDEKQYQLHAVEIALDMLNSKEFANSGMSPKDWLDAERKRLAIKSLNDSTKSF
jgi:hypothetical protein